MKEIIGKNNNLETPLPKKVCNLQRNYHRPETNKKYFKKLFCNYGPKSGH